jgi:hypothetical protein
VVAELALALILVMQLGRATRRWILDALVVAGLMVWMLRLTRHLA